jgi:hypothetical protein
MAGKFTPYSHVSTAMQREATAQLDAIVNFGGAKRR